jgi:hypothetical protein
LATLHSFRGRKREELVKGDLCELLFRHRKTQRACRIFLEWLRDNRCEASPREVSQFTRDLQSGRMVEGFWYQLKSFYQTILRRLLGFGFIAKQLRYRGMVYEPVIQPIPKRAPVLTSWWGFAYLVAEQWNEAFER